MASDLMKVAVVVGASRGIGFELAKLLSASGEQVFATCRSPSDAIDSITESFANCHAVPGAEELRPGALHSESTELMPRKRCMAALAVEGQAATRAQLPKLCPCSLPLWGCSMCACAGC